MQIVNLLLAVIFFIFAIIQLNDPDSLLWVVVYGYVSVISGLAALKKYSRIMIIVGMIITFAWGAYLSPSLIELVSEYQLKDIAASMDADKKYIEESRESLGLFIAFFALLFHFFQIKKETST